MGQIRYLLNKESYSGVQGTSMSKDRMLDVIKLCNYTVQNKSLDITYKSLQEKGPFDGAKVRTICPLLLSLGFIIEYQNTTIKAGDFFTNVGKSYARVCEAYIKSLRIFNNDLQSSIYTISEKYIRYGILHMSETEPDNKIWIVLYLLKKLKKLYWNEYLYALALKQEKIILKFDDSIDLIIKGRNDNNIYEFTRLQKGNVVKLEHNSYSYMRSLLKEGGIIEDSDKNSSVITPTGIQFLNCINKNFDDSSLVTLLYE